MRINIPLSFYFYMLAILHALGCAPEIEKFVLVMNDIDTSNSEPDDTSNDSKTKYDTDVEQNTETQTGIDSDTNWGTGLDRDIDTDTDSDSGNNDTATEAGSDSGTETETETDTSQMIDCDLTGVWGVKFTLDAMWGRAGDLWDLVLDGRGEIVIYARSIHESFDPETGKVVGTTRACGIDLPPFLSTVLLCEAYQPEFKDQVWESPNIPVTPVTSTVECPGDSCILNIDKITYFLGLSMSDIDAPFPKPAEIKNVQCDAGIGVDCFIDHDGDGEYGVTVNIVKEGTTEQPGYGCNGIFDYYTVPLSAKPGVIISSDWIARADRIHLGTRTYFSGNPIVSPDCQLIKGSAAGTGFQTRSPSCKLQPGTRDFLEDLPAGEDQYCNDTQSLFLNRNLPIYLFPDKGESPPEGLSLPDSSPSKGAEITMVKMGDLGDTVTCAEIREAEY
jgi:hypothetical protein